VNHRTGTSRSVSQMMVPVLVFVSLLLSIVSSLGAPLIPAIAIANHVSLSTAQWVLTACLMTGAVATPIMGRLADGARQRDVITVTLTIVALGCALSALSTNFLELVIGRGMQGVGLGLLPVNMAIARRHLDQSKASQAIATLSISTAVGMGLGYPLTAFITQVLGYRAAYWFGAIAVVATMIASITVLPSRSVSRPRRFDMIGAVSLGLAVVGTSVLLSEGGVWGWTSAISIGIALVSVALIATWIRHELVTVDPLVNLSYFQRRPIVTAYVAGFMMCVSLYLLIPVIVEFIQIPTHLGFGFGGTVLVSGLALMPLSAGTFIASRFLQVYELHFGIRSMIPLGALIMSGSALFFVFFHSSLWQPFVILGLAGAGVGFTFAAMPGFIIRAVEHHETGSATGMYQVLRNIGLSVGSALGAAILLAHTSPGHVYPSIRGFQESLLACALLGVLTAVVSFILPGRPSTGSIESRQREGSKIRTIMREEAELAGAGLMLADEREPLGSEDRP